MSCPSYPQIDDDVYPMGDEEEIFLKTFHYEEEDDFEGSAHMNIHMWAHNRDSDSCLARITNARVYCCLELPTYTQRRVPSPCGDWKKDTFEPDKYITWDEYLAKRVFESICWQLNRKTDWKTKNALETPFDYHFGKYRDIYYYTGTKKNYMYLFFNTVKARKDLENVLRFPMNIMKEGHMLFEMHENKISTTRRVMSKQNCRYTKWFKCKARKIHPESKLRVSKKTLTEYIINYTTMEEIPEEICKNWFVYPKIISWDGEMYSINHKQMPHHRRLHDALYMISVVFQYMEHPETMKKYCFIFGDCDENDPRLKDSEIIKYDTEKDLLIGFARMFDYLDPDMVMGYNTSSFDYPYYIGRCERNDISLVDIPNTGRLLRDVTSIYNMNWSSSGAGNNDITFIKHKGRIPFDLLPNIRRLYGLRKYTMEFVCQHFLGEGKNDVTAKEMFRIYEDMIAKKPGSLSAMTDVVAYCIQDSILPIKLFDNRKLWFHLSSLSSEAGVSILELFTRGEQIRTYSNIAHECHKRGIVLSNPQYFDYYYKGGFVGKPSPGVYKYVFTLDFSSLYPSIMRGYNLSIDSLIRIEDWPKFPEGTYESIPFTQEEPVDALSSSYKKDLEDKYKLYMSGYPVIFNQDDLSTLYMLGRTEIKRYSLNIENNEDAQILEPEDLTNKQTVIRRYEIRVIKKVFDNGSPGYEGIMSTLEDGWYKGRKEIKKKMKVCDNIITYKENSPQDYINIGIDIEKLKDEITELEKDLYYDTMVLPDDNDDDLEGVDSRSINIDVEDKIKLVKESLREAENVYKYKDFTELDHKLNASEADVHNAGQLAVKVMMNSGYGFCGVPTGMLPALPVAIVTTALGRQLIQEANDVLTAEFAQYNAKIVYNDTDSSMVWLDISEEDVLSGKIDIKKISKEMEDFINGVPEKILRDGTVIPATKAVFRDPLKMECENCCQMCPLKPKYYIKLHREIDLKKIKTHGQFKTEGGKPIIGTKGILTSKKGNAQFSNIVYNDLVENVIFMRHTCKMLMSLSSYICDFLSDRFDSKDLCKVMGLGSNYSNENYFLNVFANNIAKLGMQVKPGDRLEFLIVRTNIEREQNISQNVGEKCREYSLWMADPNREQIDYNYYIEKGLQEQYDFLFGVGNMNTINHPSLEGLGYKPQFSRCHGVHFSQPIKMISGLIKDYMKLSDEDFYKHYISYGYKYDQTKERNVHIAVLVDVFIKRICDQIHLVYPEENSI